MRLPIGPLPLLLLALVGCGGGNPAVPGKAPTSGPTGEQTAVPTIRFGGPVAGKASNPSVPAVPPGTIEYASGHILLKFRPGTDASTEAGVLAAHGGTIQRTIGGLDVQVVSVPAGAEYARIAEFQCEPSVQYAEPDYICRATFTPDDTDFATQQWDMNIIHAPEAWDLTKGARWVEVADLDTGFDFNHTDFDQQVVDSHNFTSDASAQDGHGHGTHTAGTIAALTNNAHGVAGVGFNSSLIIGKVLTDGGWGEFSWVAEGIVWAVHRQARVINMSLGAWGDDQTMHDAVDYATLHNIVVCCAAGNGNTNQLFYPASYANSLAIGATDSADARAWFSNYGDYVDVSAPGLGVYSTYHGDTYTTMSGTSMACPHVAGLAALVWSTQYGTDAQSVRDRIIATTDAITTDQPMGSGRINAARAVGAIP